MKTRFKKLRSLAHSLRNPAFGAVKAYDSLDLADRKSPCIHLQICFRAAELSPAARKWELDLIAQLTAAAKKVTFIAHTLHKNQLASYYEITAK